MQYQSKRPGTGIVATGIIYAVSLICASVCHGELLYRLPIKASGVDNEVAVLFEESIDEVFSARYTISIPPDSISFDPDSAVCSGAVDSISPGIYSFSFDFFPSHSDSAISGRFRLTQRELSPKNISRNIFNLLARHSNSRFSLCRVKVYGTRGAEVYVDDLFSGVIPFETFLSNGEHAVSVRGNYLVKESFSLKTNNCHDTILIADFWKKTAWARYSCLGISAAALAAGILLNISQETSFNDYLANRSTTQFDPLYHNYQNLIYGRNILWTTAGLSLILSAVITFDIPF